MRHKKGRKTMTLTKTERLIRALESGRNLTAEQLEARSGLVNVSSTIDRLRNEGFPIFTNTKTDRDGYKYRAYRLAS